MFKRVSKNVYNNVQHMVFVQYFPGVTYSISQTVQFSPYIYVSGSKPPLPSIQQPLIALLLFFTPPFASSSARSGHLSDSHLVDDCGSFLTVSACSISLHGSYTCTQELTCPNIQQEVRRRG